MAEPRAHKRFLSKIARGGPNPGKSNKYKGNCFNVAPLLGEPLPTYPSTRSTLSASFLGFLLTIQQSWRRCTCLIANSGLLPVNPGPFSILWGLNVPSTSLSRPLAWWVWWGHLHSIRDLAPSRLLVGCRGLGRPPLALAAQAATRTSPGGLLQQLQIIWQLDGFIASRFCLIVQSCHLTWQGSLHKAMQPWNVFTAKRSEILRRYGIVLPCRAFLS